MRPAPFLKLIWARWQPGQCSSLLASAYVLYVSLTSEKTEKGNGLHESIEIDRRWPGLSSITTPTLPLPLLVQYISLLL
jgi:hypothetical protein